MANKQQRKINKYVRIFNENLKKDVVIGAGRFKIKHLGKLRIDGLMNYRYAIIDTKTNTWRYIYVTYYDYQRTLFWTTNDFVIEARGDMRNANKSR